jgi:hypothetical protein
MDKRTLKSLGYKDYLISFRDKTGGYDEIITKSKKYVLKYINNNKNDTNEDYIQVYGVVNKQLELIYDSRK